MSSLEKKIPKKPLNCCMLEVATADFYHMIKSYVYESLYSSLLERPAATSPPPGTKHELVYTTICVNVYTCIHSLVLRSAPPRSRFYSVKCTPSVQYGISPSPRQTSHLSPIPLAGNPVLLIRMSRASEYENDSKVGQKGSYVTVPVTLKDSQDFRY